MPGMGSDGLDLQCLSSLMKGGVRKRLIDLRKNAMVCEAGCEITSHRALAYDNRTVIGGFCAVESPERRRNFFQCARHAFFVEVSEASSCEGSKWDRGKSYSPNGRHFSDNTG